MPWKERCRVEERLAFASEYARGHQTMASLCRKYGISRKTGYKWAARYLLEGVRGLEDRTSRPRSNARAVSDEIADYFIEMRRRRKWGPKKLKAVAEELNPDMTFPSASTIGELLKRHGLTDSRKYRRRTPPDTEPFRECKAPNSTWCADFKGDFQVRGRRCYPLTVMDAFSRYLIVCVGLRNTSFEAARPVFERAFEEFGLPRAIRTDNGSPFASRGAGGLSKLSAWWVKLGIRHERIAPGRPEQNGRHERMHRTLKQATASPPQASLTRQQLAFDRFRHITTRSGLMKRSGRSHRLASTRDRTCAMRRAAKTCHTRTAMNSGEFSVAA